MNDYKRNELDDLCEGKGWNIYYDIPEELFTTGQSPLTLIVRVCDKKGNAILSIEIEQNIVFNDKVLYNAIIQQLRDKKLNDLGI